MLKINVYIIPQLNLTITQIEIYNAQHNRQYYYKVIKH